ncbi:hypothetical protein [Reyranella sp. CPCC 100927]|uniref:hypothetical protein n=1 Tax=Reyranella sp. CPCC 100927 TaxID=2599616 RepID=UPI0011B75693|nr:hypothetical protein [Reyranella sp. CPCC 100927]TWS96138.1 hypothetical protein FQU96_39505 [Reyranella sp. CPCC 100927]
MAVKRGKIVALGGCLPAIGCTPLRMAIPHKLLLVVFYITNGNIPPCDANRTPISAAKAAGEKS